MRNRFQIILIAALGFSTGCKTLTVGTPQPVSLAITNTMVIDPETRQTLTDRTVLIDGERIVAIVVEREIGRFQPARTIDGTGKFLIPGLMDMHVHLFLPEPAEPSLNLLLANGVTGIREMSGDCWAAAGSKRGCIADYRRLQADIRAGSIAGPDIMSLTSTMVMGPTRMKLPAGAPGFITPDTAAEARELVRHLQGRRVDLIKTHDSIPTAAFYALMDESRRAGLPVAGHIPFGAGSVGAARAGYRSIEHARDLLYDCSSYGPDFRRREEAFAEQRPAAARPANTERLIQTVATFDPSACSRVLAEVHKAGAYYVPTHVTREMEAKAGDAAYRSATARNYVLKGRNANWEKDLNETAALPAEERAALRNFFAHGLKITGLAFRAGIPVMAGTDANDTMIIPGFSLHRELALLVEAGLPPMEALRAATSVPASYYGLSAQLGGLAAGKQADLVLLDANPLANIRNSSRVNTVVSNGQIYDRAALDALLKEVGDLAGAS